MNEEQRVAKALYDAMCGWDNQDEPLENYPSKIVRELALAGYAVVPVSVPPEILGGAQLDTVAQTRNPVHMWGFLISKTRLYCLKSGTQAKEQK